MKKRTHPQEGGHEGGEDPDHRLVTERVHGHHVEVSDEARRDGVAPATWRTHRSQELNVAQFQLARVLQVVPAQKTERT